MAEPAYEVSRLTSKVHFSLSGEHLDLSKISTTLGVEPTTSYGAGDFGESGERHSQALWLLESPLPTREAPESHLDWLRQVLAPHYDFIKSLMGSADVQLYCDIRSETDQCGFDISPKVLSMFVELGVPLEGRAHL
jgi:Domain of unknown function (DUF4279)